MPFAAYFRSEGKIRGSYSAPGPFLIRKQDGTTLPPAQAYVAVNGRHRGIGGVSLRSVLRAGFAEITDVKEQGEEEDAFKPGVLSSGVLDLISDVAVQFQNLKKIRGVSFLR